VGVKQRWHILLYDEECPFCRWSVDKVLAWDRHDRIKPVPIQGPVGQQLLAGVPEEKRLETYHLVTPAGRVLSGGTEASAELARLLPGGTPLAGVFLTFPGLTERAYRWVSDHRNELVKALRIDSDYELKRG
jgi:predicted DCC family thiol-disulfide oxidoreductase YuxK